jgi:tetratricopeptide (TPR) repeat protein
MELPFSIVCSLFPHDGRMRMSAQSELDALCQRAREHMQRREIPEAIAVYEQVLALDDRDARAHEGIATAAFIAGDLDRAETHFKRLSQIDPRRFDCLINLGAVYNRKQDYAAAVRTLQQALSKNRKSAEAYYNLGIAQKGLNQLAMAISAYKEAIRLSPQMAEAYQNLGNVYVDMGNFQQAVLNFKRALEINPQFEKARRGLAATQMRSEQQNQTANPFGRLVDTADIDRKRAEAEELRTQSSEERTADRAVVVRVAVAFEHAGHALLTHLREQLSPAILGVSHAFAQEDPAQMHVAHDALTAAVSAYRSAASLLLRYGDELQSHEETVKKQLTAAPP